MEALWPRLDYGLEQPVIETLHAYLQVVGKLPTRALPWTNHSWHLALRVVPRGLRTYPVFASNGEAELLVDLVASKLTVENSSGHSASFDMTGQTVAEFHCALRSLLSDAGIDTHIGGSPNEVEHAIPFAEDTQGRSWDPDVAMRIHRAFASANRVFERFRTGFVGKSSPSHLFWGSFDLAVTRFSGREAPLHPGGFPNLPDPVTREAYSHEVASAGFWLGGGGVDEAAFYAYGYPKPAGLAEAPITTNGAYWHKDLGEFVLPYAAVQSASDPDQVLLDFLEQTYGAVADLAGWEREDLEIPLGRVGRPYDVLAQHAAR